MSYPVAAPLFRLGSAYGDRRLQVAMPQETDLFIRA
jgi:hypothetical protein